MSKNANRFGASVWSVRFEMADEIDARVEDRLDIDYYREFRDIVPEEKHPRTSRVGAELLMKDGVRKFEIWTSINLPYNVGYLNGYQHRGAFKDPGREALIFAARFGGWLKRAAISPACGALRSLMGKTMSVRGVNSPRTTLDLQKVVKVQHSPETANRRLVAVRRRANEILAPYGVSVSNAAVAHSLSNRSAVGKAARNAAKHTLLDLLSRRFGVELRGDEARWQSVFIMCRGIATAMAESDPRKRLWAASRVLAGEFSDLRSAMAEVGRLTVDITDGVEMVTDPTLTSSHLGCKFTQGFATRGSRYSRRDHTEHMVLVRFGDRTYHAQFYPSPSTVYVAGSWVVLNTEQAALVRAREAWDQQNKAQREISERYLVPEDVCLLVYKDDSARVGNCRPGTESYMASIGLSINTRLVGGHVLADRMKESSRAEAVYAYALMELKLQLARNRAVAA